MEFAMTVSSLGGYFQNFPTKISVSSGSLTTQLQPKDAKAEFLEEATKTPAERIQEDVRKRLGISEEEFAKMDPAARAAVDDAVRAEVRRMVEENRDSGLGHFADVSA
jgi:hypothetical protein